MAIFKIFEDSNVVGGKKYYDKFGNETVPRVENKLPDILRKLVDKYSEVRAADGQEELTVEAGIGSFDKLASVFRIIRDRIPELKLELGEGMVTKVGFKFPSISLFFRLLPSMKLLNMDDVRAPKRDTVKSS